ncbi:MAG: M20/M25/M40 family metallo-hydrolase [Parvularculaceae bacterium]
MFVARFAGAFIGAAAALFATASGAAGLTPEEEAIAAAVEANAEASLGFLEKVVNINSDTMNPEGVRATGAAFAAAFEEIGFETSWEEMPPEIGRAGHFLAERDGDQGNRLLLIGHLDTVFAKDGDFQTFRREGDKAYGPGVVDMKGGDVAMLYALKALHAAGALDRARINVVFTGDEEKPGKPLSITRKSLIEAGEAADVALNFEGGEEGIAVTARRGSSGWRLTTSGKRAHSSGVFSKENGAGSIYEAARILSGFYDALTGEKYLTFNPGVIVGGTDVAFDSPASAGSAFGKTNVIAQKTIVDGDLRFISEAQKEKARERMKKIVARRLPQTEASIVFEDSYPAMEPTEGNMALLAVLSTASEDLGLGAFAANDPAKRGAADISFVAPVVPASLDGLGVRGEGAHGPGELMEVASLKEATLVGAILIYRLTRADAPTFTRSE